jgi:hypothetical protein
MSFNPGWQGWGHFSQIGANSISQMAEEPAGKSALLRQRFIQKASRLAEHLQARLTARLGKSTAQVIIDILTTPLVYLRDLQWEGDQAYGFALLRALWASGWLGRLGLASLAFGILLVSLVFGQTGLLSQTGVLILTLAGYALGWTFAFISATRAPLWGFVLASTYLLYYTVLIGGSLAHTWPFAIPSLLVLAWGWQLTRISSSRWRRLWFLALCVVVGNLTFSAFGLGRLVPDAWNLAGRMTLGLIFFGLLANPWTPSWQKAHKPTPDALIFLSALGALLLFFLLAYTRDADLTSQNLLLALRSILGLIDLAWFWLGWTLFELALDVGAWISERSIRILTPRIGGWLFPSLWGISAAFCWLAVHTVPLPFAVMAYSIGLQKWVEGIEGSLYYALYDFFYAALFFLALVLLLAVTKRLDNQRLVWVNGLWIAGFAGLYWYYQNMAAFATLEEDAAAPLGLIAGLSLVGGIIWELARSGSSYLGPDSRQRIFAILAGLFFLLSISSFILVQGLPDLTMEYTLYSFLGVLYLGLPLAIYSALPEQIDYTPVSGLRLLGLFGFGMLSAVGVMGIAYNAGLHLAIAALLWAITLWLAGKPLARLENRLDGIAAGASLSLGFSIYWMSPQFLPVPFLTWFNDWQMRYLLLPLNRPMLQPAQAIFTIISLAAGIMMGIAFSGRRRKLWVVVAALAAALLLGLALPAIPGIPHV